MSLDDLDQPHLLQRLRNLLGLNLPPTPGSWDAALRLACQALVQAPGDVRAVRLDGFADGHIPYGTRILHFMNRVEAIADEYGLHAHLDYRGGAPSVTLARK